MRKSRTALVALVACGAVLLGAQAALAKTWKIPTSGGGGHALFSLTDVGGVGEGTVGSIRACDDDKDGSGVVAFVFDDGLLLGKAESRGGKGTCGRGDEVDTKGHDGFVVKVCLHDESEDGVLSDPDDSDLKRCEVRIFD